MKMLYTTDCEHSETCGSSLCRFCNGEKIGQRSKYREMTKVEKSWKIFGLLNWFKGWYKWFR